MRTFEEASIPIGITAWELFQFRTKLISSGDLATAIRASCTFPGLFAPVLVDGSLCIDGGVFDDGGCMALPGIPESELVVNIVCGRNRLGSSILPEKFKHARLLTLVMDNIPSVSPFTMSSHGPIAYKVARIATYKALHSSHTQQLSKNHWCCFIDGFNIDPETPLNLPRPSAFIPRSESLSSIYSEDSMDTNDPNTASTLEEATQELPRVASFSFLNRSSTSDNIIPRNNSNISSCTAATSVVDGAEANPTIVYTEDDNGPGHVPSGRQSSDIEARLESQHVPRRSTRLSLSQSPSAGINIDNPIDYFDDASISRKHKKRNLVNIDKPENEGINNRKKRSGRHEIEKL